MKMTAVNKTEEASISKLQSEQNKALLECQETIAKWHKFHGDYVDLKKRLETLPDNISYDVMVPFGSVAFMPGRMIHTNEIMVLLGDNWFVNRSAKQACDIVGRRIEKCEQTIRSLELENQQLQNWNKYTQTVKEEAKQFVEIVEDYDEESEKAWKEKHKVRLKQQREQKQNSSAIEVGGSRRTTSDGPSVSSETADDEFWRRLDELEIEELEAKHLESMAGVGQQVNQSVTDASFDGDRSLKRSDSDLEKRVMWKDDLLGVQSSPKTGAVVKVDFSDAQSITPNYLPVYESPTRQAASPDCNIQSPADIYALFGANQETQPQPKSILKKSKSYDSMVVESQSDPVTDKPAHNEASVSSIAELPVDESMPETKVDHEIEAVAEIVAERASGQLETNVVSTAPRRVSKFRSQRQAKSQ